MLLNKWSLKLSYSTVFHMVFTDCNTDIYHILSYSSHIYKYIMFMFLTQPCDYVYMWLLIIHFILPNLLWSGHRNLFNGIISNPKTCWSDTFSKSRSTFCAITGGDWSTLLFIVMFSPVTAEFEIGEDFFACAVNNKTFKFLYV